MRNITQQEVDAIQNDNAPVPINVVFEYWGERFHRVASDNACAYLGATQFLVANMSGDRISVFHINSIQVPMKKPQVEQKKRKKYKRPCNGVDYLEKIPFEYSKVKVGDKVQLRDGSKDVIVEIYQGFNFPLIGKQDTYTKKGKYWIDGEECGSDILYIIRKIKKSVPKTEQKKDEFRFVNSSTGQEIVFSRDELQLIKEIIGKVAERRDALDNNYFGNKHRRTMHGICDMLYYAGFCENYKFTNDIVLRPDTPTLIFKE